MSLALCVVYDHPKDFPNHIVVRRWLLDTPTDIYSLYPSLEHARAALIHAGLSRIARDPDDDPVIVETWL